MRRALIAGNWKLHGTVEQTVDRVRAIAPEADAQDNVELAVCPTFVHLPVALQQATGTALAVGSQDVSEVLEGAYTGEVSAPMLRDLGCRYAIVGHSERRTRHGETDACVTAKFAAAQEAGVTPILCVGESLEDRDAGRAVDVVRGQLLAVLNHVGADGFTNAVVAYEPVWAIGTGRTATPEQAQEIHAALRSTLQEASAPLGAETRILYGGSVKAANAAELFAQADIDGALVGGASLDANEFIAIARAAA